MATFIAIPILTSLMILQSGVVSRIPLLHGTPDLLLLAIIAWALQKKVQTAWHWCIIGGILFSLVSALPFGAALLGYLLATGIALLLRQQVWQAPILAMLVAILLGTFISHSVSLIALRVIGDPIPVLPALNLIILPSIFLNLILAIPAYALLGDLANWLYPEELEV
jgi:rod shape-determining protein MreD